jgi:hypothetical protein
VEILNIATGASSGPNPGEAQIPSSRGTPIPKLGKGFHRVGIVGEQRESRPVLPGPMVVTQFTGCLATRELPVHFRISLNGKVIHEGPIRWAKIPL